MQGARTAAEARVAELNACLEELFAEEEMEEREQELAQVCIGGRCAVVMGSANQPVIDHENVLHMFQ